MCKSRYKILSFLIGIVLVLSPFEVLASKKKTNQAPPEVAAYKKKEIIRKRFGDKARQGLLEKAYKLKKSVSTQVIGQDHIAQALQDRMIQYLENLGSRTSEPIALHLIGLPGIGKSSILKVLKKAGFQVLRIDAQKYVSSEQNDSVATRMFYLLENAFVQAGGKPLVILFDELDKVAEIGSGVSKEKTQALIGLLNEILTEGKIQSPYQAGKVLELSNTFILTAMNLAPQEVEAFSKDALGAAKSFWDFTEEDLKRFDQWIRISNASNAALAKVFEKLFRSNTISRLLPDAIIAKPLYGEDFTKIIRNNVDETIQRTTQGAQKGKGLNVKYTDAYVEFLRAKTVYSPIGARMNVKKVDLLTEQLIDYAARAAFQEDESFNIPRSVLIDFDSSASQIVLTITPKIRKGKQVISRTPFQVRIAYDSNSSAFIMPENVVLTPPDKFLKEKGDEAKKEKPVTQAAILKKRFPPKSKSTKGLAKKLNQKIFGQEDITKLLEERLGSYLMASEPSLRPEYEIFAGFPGIGKTLLVVLAGEALKLPVLKINMQEFSSQSDEAVRRFGAELYKRIEAIKATSPNGKYILLIEELDKAFEVNPKTGELVTRPVLAFIKDLLSDGAREFVVKSGFSEDVVKIDIREAFTIFTMNFATELFDFKADPRRTTIEDVMEAWKDLNTSAQELRNVLMRMFLPETVNRLISNRFHIIRPFLRKHYEDLIHSQIVEVIQEKFFNPKTGQNTGAIDLRVTKSYREQYLANESIIPSEGARQTMMSARALLQRDIEEAVSKLEKDSVFARKPIVLQLDYKPASERRPPRIEATVFLKGDTIQHSKLFSKVVELRFPPLKAYGALPEDRVFTGVHEFGHAFSSVLLGHRFEYATVIPPEKGTGGYVKFIDGKIHSNTASKLIASIYSALGSRAIERIFLSDNPQGENSVLQITAGASSDIKGATITLWNLLYELGMDPKGGVIERTGMKHNSSYGERDAFFEGIPDDKVESLAMILRDMEDHLVNVLLSTHTQEWFRDKIFEFASMGGTTEKEFYELLGYFYPGDNAVEIGEESSLQAIFKGRVRPEPKEARLAKKTKLGESKKTARQNLKVAVDTFAEILTKRLHSDSNTLRENLAHLLQSTRLCEALLTTAKQ